MSHRWVSMITGIVFIGLFSGTTAALAAYPYVFTAWKKITISQDECVRRATNVLRNNNYSGMTAGIKGNDTMLGGLGDYVGLVRCAASVGVVFFVVTGPAQDPALNYTNALSNGF
jgi:hypothetical protein